MLAAALATILVSAPQDAAAAGGKSGGAVEITLRHRIAPIEEDDSVPLRESVLRVEVGSGLVRIRGEGPERVYDFAAGRRETYDRERGLLFSTSLLAAVSFRHREMTKILGWRDDLGIHADKMDRLSVALTEHRLGIRAASGPETVERVAGDEGVRFTWQGRDLAFVDAERLPVSAAALRDYVRYLRYEMRGHPLVMEEIAGGAGVPRLLRVFLIGAENRAIEVEVQSVHPSEDSPPAREGLQRAWPLPDRLTLAMAAAFALEPWDAEAAADALEAQAAAAFARGALLEALLRSQEAELMTGLPLPSAHRERLRAYDLDPEASEFRAALEASDAEAARAAAQHMAALRGKMPEQAHVIGVLEARLRAGIGEGQMAANLLIQALQREPRLGAAWAELGDLLAADYDLEGAWACWEAGHAASPECRWLRPFRTEEARLLRKYPEYF